MTDERNFDLNHRAAIELFRLDCNGKLVFTHPDILALIDARIAPLQEQITALTNSYTELRQELRKLLDKKAPPDVGPFGSADALVAHIEHMFDCRDGEFGMYTTVPTLDEKGKKIGWHPEPYTVLAMLLGGEFPQAPEQLRQALYRVLFQLKATCKSPRPVLYWRYSKEMRIEETRKREEQSLDNVFKIRTRLAIPEADFSVVGAIAQDGTKPVAVLQE